MTKTMFVSMALASAMVLAACAQDDDEGRVSVEAAALSFPSQVTRMVLTVQPGNQLAELINDGGNYRGSVLVPAGEHTFRVEAFSGEQSIGAGSVAATVVANEVTALHIAVLDTTGAGPDLPHSPLVLSFTASNVQPQVGQAVALNANIVDVDGDPITYAWSSTCASSQFDRTDAASVSWTSSAPGACTIRLDATAGGVSLTRLVNVVVFTGDSQEGAIDVEATFVSNPYIEYLSLRQFSGDRSFQCDLFTWSDGSCPGQLSPGAMISSYLNVVPALEWTISDDCGGTAGPAPYSPTEWRAPDHPAVCKVTFSATNSYGLTGRLSAAILVL